jgi:hypothetical protein
VDAAGDEQRGGGERELAHDGRKKISRAFMREDNIAKE